MEAQFPVLCSSKPLKPGSEKFQRIPITTNVFKLGRGHHNTIVIPHKCLSKEHCVFKKVEEDWMLENCSYASIKVNGDKLRKGQKRKLVDQDIIKLESSNELVYTFMSSTNSSKRKRRKLDDDVQNDNIVRTRSESLRSKQNDKIENTEHTGNLKEQIMSEQSRKEKEIYDDYAVRIEKLKGTKKIVKRSKALLKMRRDTQLELLRVKMEERMASVTTQQNPESLNETKDKHSKDKPSNQRGHGDQKTSREDSDQSGRREQERARQKEKKELKKLRRETRRLKLDKEKKLKELEKLKVRREKELQDELIKVNKKLAKERELHEKERRRVEQLLNQKKEELRNVACTSSGPKLDMESELQCSICSELFVRATTLACSHSFCRYCIRKWTLNKKECPICRAPITSECRSIVLDSLVEKMAETADAKKKRQELVKTRDELEAKEPTAAVRNNDQDLSFENLFSDLIYEENSDSNSSYYGRESSLEPDESMLVPMYDFDSNSDSESSDNYGGENSGESENYGGENSGESENYEGENSGPEYEDEDSGNEQDNDINDPDFEPEHYDGEEPDGNSNSGNDENSNEGYEQEENDADSNEEESAPENYDEGENSAPEYDEGENSLPEYDEPENSAPEYDEPENSAPEYDEPENSAPEYDEPENSAPEEFEGENSGPENYDEGENSPPEYDEGENSPPEYDGDSYPGDGDGEDYDDYY